MPMPGRSFSAYQDFLRHVLVDDVDGVKIITLRRPDALNALHDEMTDEILDVIRKYEGNNDVSGFVIIGYGTRAFCAGADIGRFTGILGMAFAFSIGGTVQVYVYRILGLDWFRERVRASSGRSGSD